MKPLVQFPPDQPLARYDDRAGHSTLRTFPRTDHQFHAPAQENATARNQPGAPDPAELRAFRQISRDYLGEKTSPGYLSETIVFALVAGLVAWPLISLLIVMAQTANG
jgi:hypothetical protein